MTDTYMTQYSKFSRVCLTNLLYKGRKCYSEVHWDAMLKESSPEFLLQTYYNVILFIILLSAENIPLSGRKGKKEYPNFKKAEQCRAKNVIHRKIE